VCQNANNFESFRLFCNGNYVTHISSSLYRSLLWLCKQMPLIMLQISQILAEGSRLWREFNTWHECCSKHEAGCPIWDLYAVLSAEYWVKLLILIH
jgi:hypothetical protein